MPDTTAYMSEVRYEPRFDAAAIYCCDGRFASACDRFLDKDLGLTHTDRLVVPGGPGALVGHEGAALEAEALLEDLRFLVEAHGLDRLVLIMHEHCGHYLSRVGVSEAELPARQRRDVVLAAKRAREVTRIARIEAYRAEVDDGGRIIFTPLPLE